MCDSNPGCDFDTKWLEDISVDLAEVEKATSDILTNRKVLDQIEQADIWLQAVSMIDLTTLNAYDTESTVRKLCERAAAPLSVEVVSNLKGADGLHTAAVCVYPSRISDAKRALEKLGKLNVIEIASVAAGFPSGQFPLQSRLLEIELCIQYGATEIDVVIDRSLAITGDWATLYDEIRAFKKVCQGRAHLKTILAVGELANFTNVYKASVVAMMAGSDFIKTSTGKETVNATLPAGLVMCRAINDYHNKTGVKVGFKPAGGIRTASDAENWLHLVLTVLGPTWISPNLFRFGASGLLDDLDTHLTKYAKTVSPCLV